MPEIPLMEPKVYRGLPVDMIADMQEEIKTLRGKVKTLEEDVERLRRKLRNRAGSGV